jgi:hypothetical protein
MPTRCKYTVGPIPGRKEGGGAQTKGGVVVETPKELRAKIRDLERMNHLLIRFAAPGMILDVIRRFTPYGQHFERLVKSAKYKAANRKCRDVVNASMDITEFASMGGKASARGMTAQQRSARASRAALAMWEKKRLAARKPKARKPRKAA